MWALAESTKCISHVCANAGNTLITAAATTDCLQAGCDDATCCELKKCDSHICTGGGTTLITNAYATNCATGGCDDATCCEGNKYWFLV